MLSGDGVIVNPHCVYEGGYLNGKRHGTAIVTEKSTGRRKVTYDVGVLTDGIGVKDKKFASFQGDFSDGMLKTGSIVYPDGKCFTGTFNGKRIVHGRGLFRCADGSAYEGEWVKGSKHGKGNVILYYI